jgi:hypothetical protein
MLRAYNEEQVLELTYGLSMGLGEDGGSGQCRAGQGRDEGVEGEGLANGKYERRK